jgi:glycosyltransferase involved in cell wall biosynthesis
MKLKLQRLLEHPEQWREMGIKGRAIVADRFDIRKLNKRLVEIFKILVSEDRVVQ